MYTTVTKVKPLKSSEECTSWDQYKFKHLVRDERLSVLIGILRNLLLVIKIC